MKLWMGLLLVALLTLSSCSPRMMPVNQLRNLSERIEMNGDVYSYKDWKKAKNKFVKINRKIVKHRAEYTVDELAEIATLQGQCITGFGKGLTSSALRGIVGLGAGVKSLADEIKDLIEEFKKKKE